MSSDLSRAGGAAGAAPPVVTVADAVLRLASVDSDDAARALARVRIADTALATAVGGASCQGRRSREVADALYGAGSAAATAYRLVATCRLTEIDDVDLRSCITPGSSVVPTALVAARLVETSAEAVLDAVVAGYEIALGLGEAMQGPSRLAEGVWPSLATGAVVSAAVASLVLGGDRADLEQAVVLASEQSIAGNARGNAREGLLAGAVVTGLGAALAVRRGFAVTGTRGGGVLAALLVDHIAVGATPRIARPVVKQFCSARQAMGPVAALRAVLAETPVAAADVEAIEVEVPHEYAAMLSRGGVGSRRESLSNVAYQLALALCAPQRLEDVERSDLGIDDRIDAVMRTVSVRGSDDLSALYPDQWPARVELRAGGRSHRAEALSVPGEEDHSRAAIETKAPFLADRPALAELVLTTAWEAADAADLARLTAAIDGVHHPEGVVA